MSDQVGAVAHQACSYTAVGNGSQQWLRPSAAHREHRLEGSPLDPGFIGLFELSDSLGER